MKCFLSIRAAVAFRQMCELSEIELREREQQSIVSVKLERIDAEIDPQISVLAINCIKEEREEAPSEVESNTEYFPPYQMPPRTPDEYVSVKWNEPIPNKDTGRTVADPKMRESEKLTKY